MPLTTDEIKAMRHLVMAMSPIDVTHNGFRQHLVDIIDELIERREQDPEFDGTGESHPLASELLAKNAGAWNWAGRIVPFTTLPLALEFLDEQRD
jgi:hypothetical protein